jgi:hypothetical protein
VADVTITLYNAQGTSGGTGPGQVTIPAAEAQPLVDGGYAGFVAGDGP